MAYKRIDAAINTTGKPYGYYGEYGYKGLTQIGWMWFANEADYIEFLEGKEK